MTDKITSGQLFMGLVYSLTQSAFISLGKLPDPMSGAIERNLPQASQTIDLLAAIQEKTKGNLEEDEEKFLNRTISDLRLNYVDEVNKQEEEKNDSKDKAKKEEAEKKKDAKEKSQAEEKPAAAE